MFNNPKARLAALLAEHMKQSGSTLPQQPKAFNTVPSAPAIPPIMGGMPHSQILPDSGQGLSKRNPYQQEEFTEKKLLKNPSKFPRITQMFNNPKLK